MYDIFFIAPKKTDYFFKLKEKYPLIKHATTFQQAQERCLTAFFWTVYHDLIVEDDFHFDYIPDDWSKNYVHVFLNDQHYDGIALVPSHLHINHKEISYRFFVSKKEVEIVASKPTAYDVFEIDTYDEYRLALETSSTDMFWMSSRNIAAIIPDLYFDYSNTYDRTQNHVFIHQVNNAELYNGLFLCSKHKTLSSREIEFRHIVGRKEWDIVGSTAKSYDQFTVDSYEEYIVALETSKTEMFWVIPSTVRVTPRFKFDTYFSHDQLYDRTINHVFLNGKYRDGVILCSTHSRISRREFDYRFIAHKKEWDYTISFPLPYDVVFISFNEPNADENYQELLKKIPTAKRVDGVVGIHNAHIEAAKLCSTDMFWVVDADAEIDNSFDFSYQVPRWDKDTVHVWRSQNPINGLVYGYGGVKLFPRQLTLNMDTSKPDMTTSISSKFNAVPEISNVTKFNTDPFNTWKSAFRECVKLSSKIIDRQKDDETLKRLETWCSVGADKLYGEYAILGAKAGTEYGAENKDDMDKLKLINNFEWLKEKFNDTQQ